MLSEEGRQKIREGAKVSAAKSKAQHIIRINSHKQNCVLCQKSIDYARRENKFCSSSCAAKYNNVRRAPRIKKLPGQCKFCNTPLPANRKFCSNTCQGKFSKEITANNIKTGKSVSVCALRKWMRENNPHKCQICSIATWEGKPVPLIMDHIDGNSENNLLTNLRLICPNCDAQLPTYKSRNIGNGRAYRRQRYAEGKSY